MDLFLHHLAIHQDVQETLYQEVLENIGTEGRVTEESLRNMRYLKACIKESMRISPIFASTGRRTTVDMELGGYYIPKGTKAIRYNYFSAMDAQNFDEPEAFKPERWIRGSKCRKPSDPFAHL